MDPTPAPGVGPAVASIDKAETELKPADKPTDKPADTPAVPAVEKGTENSAEEKPTEEKLGNVKPVKEKHGEPACTTETAAVPVAEPAKLEQPSALSPQVEASFTNASVVDAPKPASVEEVPQKESPVATNGDEEPEAVASEHPATTATAAATTITSTTNAVKESVDEAMAQKPSRELAVEDEALKEPIMEKPDAVNGAATKDVKMTGALNEAEPERETAPQAIPPEPKTGDKRKANDFDAANGTAEEKPDPAEKPVEKKVKTGQPSQPPTDGAAKGSPKKDVSNKESLGRKVANNVKKVLSPVGKTARKTRSQGPV